MNDDRVNHAAYIHTAPAKPCGRGCGCGPCAQRMSGVGDQIKDNAWVIAAGASLLFLGLALVRRGKKK